MLTRFNSNTDEQVGNVDKEQGVIYGVSVITGNREAKGHNMYIDDTTVDQVVEFGKEADKGVGLKSRFDHPNACFSSMGTQLGRFKNFRREDEKAVADLHLLDANKEHKQFILDMADEDPDMFATSIVFQQGDPYTPQHEDNTDLDESDPFFLPHTRIDSLLACDVVDEGAANDGLFGRPDYLAEQAERWANEHKDIIDPILFKIFEKYQKSMENKEEKTGFQEAVDGLKSGLNTIVEKFGLKSEKEETKEEEKDEISEEKTFTQGDVDVLNEEIEQLKSDNAELSGVNTELKEAVEGMNVKIEELSKTILGAPVKAEGGEQEDTQYKETKEDKKEAKKLSLQEARELAIKSKGY